MEISIETSTSVLPKSTPTVASATPEDGNLEDFASFADTYLLSHPELADVSGALDEPLSKMPRGDTEGPHMRFDWGNSDSAARTSEEPTWNKLGDNRAADLMEAQAVDKGRAETGDSSEWDQTREQLGNNLPVVKHTDSPESVLMGSACRPLPLEEQPQSMGHVMRLNGGTGYGGTANSFMHRGRPAGGGYFGDGPEPMQVPSSQANFGRIPPDYLEQDNLDSIGSAMMWERRGSAAGATFSTPFESDFRHPMRPESRGFYGETPGEFPDVPDGLGHMRMGMRRTSVPSIYRMHSDMSGLPQRERYPMQRQCSADLMYDMRVMHPEALPEAALDPVFDHGQMHPVMQMEGYGRSMRTSQSMGGMQSMGGHGSYYAHQQPMSDTNLMESSRKRMRESYMGSSDNSLPPQEHSQGVLRVSPRLQARNQKVSQEEHLISTLKRQIAALDPQTKGTLKDSLYRISRNTNARQVSGTEQPPSRMSARNTFVDRLVANLMYNRFEAAATSSPIPRQPGNMGGAPYGQPTPLNGVRNSPSVSMDPGHGV